MLINKYMLPAHQSKCCHVIAMLVYVVFESINEKFCVLFLVLVIYFFLLFLWNGSQGMEDFVRKCGLDVKVSHFSYFIVG